MADLELNSIGNGDGNNYLLRDNTKIPLSGSNQISGDLIPSTDNSIDIGSSTKNLKMLYTKGITIDGAQFLPSDYNKVRQYISEVGFFLDFYATQNGKYYDARIHISSPTSTTATNSSSLSIECTELLPWFNGSSPIGNASKRWGQIYSTNSAISTSDERQKDNIKQIDDKLLQAWGNVNIVQFNFKDALEKKGENARLHTGYIAQNIQQACEENGVNPNDYGLFCHDSWEEQEEKKDENGQVIEPYRAKGDLYSLRYEEALVVECAYLRRENAKLKEQLQRHEDYLKLVEEHLHLKNL